MTYKNSTLTKLQKLNPDLNILSVYDESFSVYGKLINLECKFELLNKLEKETLIPKIGNVYKPFVREWEENKIVEELSPYFDNKIEIGYCNGQNTKLNALEWHNCNEINIYSTDVVLFLAKTEDLSNLHELHSEKVQAFYVPKNTSILLFNSTLHFSPCRVEEQGFKAIIILSDNTNTELDERERESINKTQDKYKSLLLKRNKYIICHKEASNLITQNVKPSIYGNNLSLNI